MEHICPVCNGIGDVRQECPHCGTLMKDTGTVKDYLGPYSPYDDPDLYIPPACRAEVADTSCVHLYACPVCGYDRRVAVSWTTPG